MKTLDWNQARQDLASAIKESLASFHSSHPDTVMAGLGIHIDGCEGDMGLYILPHNTDSSEDIDVSEIGDWPISTDWDQELEFAKAFLAKWEKWSEFISDQFDELTEEECELVFLKLLETACCSLSDLEAEGLLDRLNKTDDFIVIISEHDEPPEYGVERYDLFKKTGTVRVYGDDE